MSSSDIIFVSKVFISVLICLLIISLGVNVLLITNLKNIKEDCKIETGTDKTYTKYELEKLFKRQLD